MMKAICSFWPDGQPLFTFGDPILLQLYHPGLAEIIASTIRYSRIVSYPYFAEFCGMNLCVRKCHIWSIANNSLWDFAQDFLFSSMSPKCKLLTVIPSSLTLGVFL